MARWGEGTHVFAEDGAVSEIPAKLVEKIRQFIRDGCTGNITLHFNQGRVLSYEIHEKAAVRGEKAVDRLSDNVYRCS